MMTPMVFSLTLSKKQKAQFKQNRQKNQENTFLTELNEFYKLNGAAGSAYELTFNTIEKVKVV